MFGELENRTVMDAQWRYVGKMPDDEEREIEERKEPGYYQPDTGVFVAEEDAFDYAMEHCVEMVPKGFRKISWTQEFKEMLFEWFYSNWAKIG